MEQFNALLVKIKEYISIDEELEVAINDSFKRVRIPKGTQLLAEGQYCKHMYYIESGFLRNYFNHEKLEVSTWFQIENQFTSSWYSFYSGEVGYEAIIAEEDSVVFQLHQDKYEVLLKSFPQFERFARMLAQEQVIMMDSFNKGYMFLSAKEKYELIQRFIPNIDQRMKLGQIASFLGITQETLSRVRRGG